MKLIDLYLDEIRRQLPPKNREDILKEIHFTLMEWSKIEFPIQPKTRMNR